MRENMEVEQDMDPNLLKPHSPEDQRAIAKMFSVTMPQTYIFNGYQRGPHASHIRCSICGRLLGHGTSVVAHNGLAHTYCYAQAAKAGQVIAPRPAVQWFAEEMERQLRQHDATKGERGWDNLSANRLRELLDGELAELDNAFGTAPANWAEVIHEASDVANICMMLADHAKARLQLAERLKPRNGGGK